MGYQITAPVIQEFRIQAYQPYYLTAALRSNAPIMFHVGLFFIIGSLA